jgi:sugar transferase (PEP-CTERM system associated)
MVRIFRHYVSSTMIAIACAEAMLLVVAVYVGAFARFSDPSEFTAGLIRHAPDAGLFVGAILPAMYALGAYRPETLIDMRVSAVRIGVSFCVGFVVVGAFNYAIPSFELWRSALAIALPTGFFSVLTFRVAAGRVVSSTMFKRRVLVLGAGAKAVRIGQIGEGSQRGFVCLGFVRNKGEDFSGGANDIVGSVDDLGAIARQANADEVVVAIEDRRKNLPVDQLLDLRLAGIGVLDFSSFWERELGRIDLDTVYPSWFIFSDGFCGQYGTRAVKRTFDIVVGAAVLIATAPLLALTAIAIKLDSPGPVFYRQERVGLHGHPFMLLKFRSMVADAEKDSVPRWAGTGDPRVTRVGRFIRMTRIDEIPQAINVLKGEMSLIGPRPERPFFVKELARQIPYYGERHRMKPGITGWAQINFPYGASVADAKRKLEFDLYYIKNHSLFLDALILLETARVVLWREGAR